MASTPSRSELGKNLLLASGSVIGTLLVLELGVRLFAPVPLVASDLFLVTERLPEVQVRTARRALKPDVQCRQTSAEYDVAVRINHQGLRDVPHAYTKPPGTTRILFLGDSFVFGYGVEEAQRFTNLVQDQLNRHPPAGRPTRPSTPACRVGAPPTNSCGCRKKGSSTILTWSCSASMRTTLSTTTTATSSRWTGANWCARHTARRPRLASHSRRASSHVTRSTIRCSVSRPTMPRRCASRTRVSW